MLFVFKSDLNETFTYHNTSHAPKIIYEDIQNLIRIRTMSLTELDEVRSNWLVPEG